MHEGWKNSIRRLYARGLTKRALAERHGTTVSEITEIIGKQRRKMRPQRRRTQRKRRKLLIAEDIRQMRRLHESGGLGLDALARIYGITEHRVRKLLASGDGDRHDADQGAPAVPS